MEGASGDEVVDDFAVDIGESEVAALEAVGEAGVLHAEEVEERGLQVVDMDGVGGDAGAEVVGGAVGVARAQAAAGHEDAEAVGVVVAPEAGQTTVAEPVAPA